MSSRRANSQHTEVRRQTTISYYLSSNLLESTQMHGDDDNNNNNNTTSGSGCSQSRLVKPLGQSQSKRRQREHAGSSGRWHLLLNESTDNVMPIRVSSTLHYLDTQRTESVVNCRRSPRDKRGARPLNGHWKLNASPIVAQTLWVLLSSCCFLLVLATRPGQCAPTTKIVSHQPLASSSININNNNDGPSPHSPKLMHHHTTANNQQQIIMTNEQAASGLVDVQPVIIVNPAHHESSKRHELTGGSATPAHHRADKFVGADDESSIEDEIVLLVLAGESAPPSIRRLIKRSGISDQRLAEIQMIRALKKQMERAATKIAAESGGNGASGTAGGDMK